MAIAFVNASSKTRAAVTTSQTYTSYNVSTSNLIIVWAHNFGSTTDIFTGVTFNGNAMTRVPGASGATTLTFLACYYIYGQSGTHDIVISGSGTNDWTTAVATYSGCLNSSSVIDASNFIDGGTGTSFNLTVSASATTGCWAVGSLDTFGQAVTITSPAVSRSYTDVNYGVADSNTTITTSTTYTMNGTMVSGHNFGGIVSIAPNIPFTSTPLAQGSFGLAGQAMAFLFAHNYTVALVQGAYSLLGQAVAVVGSLWTRQTKGAANTFTNDTEHSSAWTNGTKDSSTFTNSSKSS